MTTMGRVGSWNHRGQVAALTGQSQVVPLAVMTSKWAEQLRGLPRKVKMSKDDVPGEKHSWETKESAA